MNKGYVKIGLLAMVVTMVVSFIVLTQVVYATNTPYKTICHHTPSNQVTLNFNNPQSYFGHLGTPHSGQTYDTNGACTSPTPTPTPTPTVTPMPTVTPTPNPCEEGVSRLSKIDDEENPCPTPTPTVIPTPEATPSATPTPEPQRQSVSSSSNSTPSAPTCNDGNTTKVAANVQVARTGDKAEVTFFITEGDSANIYYSVVGQPHWQYAVSDLKPNGDKFVSFTVGALDPQLGYEFGIQQKNGCGGGEIYTTAVVVDGPATRTFRVNYYE